MRDIVSFAPRRVDGTEDATNPFFSPDGAWIGYFENAANELKKVRVDGGALITICKTGFSPRGASWGSDGFIYFNESYFVGIHRVPDTGGESETLTTPNREAGEKTHRFPRLLPDEESLVFMIGSSTMRSYDEARLAVLDLDTGDIKLLTESGNAPRYVRTGHIVYGRSGTLMAVPFDLSTREIVGGPRRVFDGVVTSPTFGAAHFDVSENGHLVYAPGGVDQHESTVQLIEADGTAKVVPLNRANYNAALFSPDGTRLLLWRDMGNADLWIYDIARQTSTRIVAEWDNEWVTWSAAGDAVTFSSNRNGEAAVMSVDAAGNRGPERLFESTAIPSSWSSDGRKLFLSAPTDQGEDLVVWDSATRRIEPLLSTAFNELGAVLSPDGSWLAYASDDSGRMEFFVARFPEMSSRKRVSVDGLGEVRAGAASWSSDGGALYYHAGSQIKKVTITMGSELEVGLPETVLEVPNLRQFDVSPDGKTFAVVTGDVKPITHLNVVLNWLDELRVED